LRSKVRRIRFSLYGALGASCALASCLAAACARPPVAADQADLIVQNGKVYTGVDGVVADAVAVRGTTILRVGSAREVDGLRGPRTQVVDAHGGTIAPGFNDSHVHFLSGALALDQVDLGG
jgi:predicted amidohydrolase YtcJ